MGQNLLMQLSEFTKKFKINEEEYLKKYKETSCSDNRFEFENSTKFEDLNSPNHQSMNVTDSKENSIKIKNQEINNLLNSINQLASLFKDLQVLVLEQGTILDRIDFNISCSNENVEKAHKDLQKANKNLEKNCARNTNLCLIITIFVFAILLILKYLK